MDHQNNLLLPKIIFIPWPQLWFMEEMHKTISHSLQNFLRQEHFVFLASHFFMLYKKYILKINTHINKY